MLKNLIIRTPNTLMPVHLATMLYKDIKQPQISEITDNVTIFYLFKFSIRKYTNNISGSQPLLQAY